MEEVPILLVASVVMELLAITSMNVTIVHAASTMQQQWLMHELSHDFGMM